MTDQNRNSLLGIVASLAIGALVILAGSDGSSTAGSASVFAVCGLLAYLINWVVFVPSTLAKTEHYFDLTGSATYVTVIAVALVLSDELDARSLIVGAMVAVWAMRLGFFLFRRVRRAGQDARFDRIKADPLRFFMTWTLQGLWVLLTLACALAIITGIEREPLGWVAVLGIVVWTGGFTLEVVADRQKSAFKRDSANQPLHHLGALGMVPPPQLLRRDSALDRHRRHGPSGVGGMALDHLDLTDFRCGSAHSCERHPDTRNPCRKTLG